MRPLKLRDEAGYTMLGVLFVFIMLAVLGLSITTLSLTSLNTSASERDNQSAFYIAEAGFNKRMKVLNEEIKEIYGKDIVTSETDFLNQIKFQLEESSGSIDEETVYDDFEKVNQDQPKATVTVSKSEENENEFYVESTGVIGKQSRTVAASFGIDWVEKEDEGSGGTFPPFAVFTSGYFTMKGSKIIGDIGTVNSQDHSLSFPGNSGSRILNGDVYVPDPGNYNIDDPNEFISELKELDSKYTFPELKPFPEIPSEFKKIQQKKYNTSYIIENNKLSVSTSNLNNYTLNMEEDLEFSEIEVISNHNLYIDLSNGDRSLVVDDLNISQGKVYLTGDGNLTIYVRNEFTLNGSSVLNKDGNPNKLNIYYGGTNDISWDGSQKMHGSIFINDANLTLKGSSILSGNIFNRGVDKTISLEGHSYSDSQLIFSPYSRVFLTGSGSYEGKIISKEFKLDNSGSTVKFNNDIKITGPLSEEALVNYNESIGNGEGESGSMETSFTIITNSMKEVQ